jgi:malonate-semialdehyde dehydrogenase (acetylating)/methylmalonate-semialdehyde dehydrogenase
MSSSTTIQTQELENYVQGAWRRSGATEFVDVLNPATAELLARTPLSTTADVDAAVQSGVDAFPAWRRTPPGERIQYLFKLKNLLEEHLGELARLITIENGKTLAEAKAELRRGIENVEVACGIPMMMQGYNLEDVTPGVDETLIRQRALQFPRDDFLLVFTLRDRLRQHVCVETIRARAADHEAHL